MNGPSGRLREEVTREKYEELTKDLLNRTKNLMDDVLKTAQAKGYSKEPIDKVLEDYFNYCYDDKLIPTSDLWEYM